ncbi:histidine kinase [Paenibacillus larvae]
MNTGRKRYGRKAFFLLMNGLLTVMTSLLIVISIFAMMGVQLTDRVRLLPVFIFVLVVTTAFFVIIYWQGRWLRTEQQMLSNVFEHISDGVLVLNKYLEIVKSNPAARQLLQLPEDAKKISYCSLCSNYPGLEKLCDYDSCYVATHQHEPVEVQIRTPVSESASVTVTTSEYEDPDHGPMFILRVRKVGDERKEEQEKIAKMITRSILQAQENERKRISRELHDGIGQQLYIMMIHLGMIKAEAEGQDSIINPLGELEESTRLLIQDVRHLSAELRPSTLDDIGLVAALRNYIQDYSHKFGIQVHFAYEGSKERFPAPVETALYRICQEALINAAKYAQTENIHILLDREPDQARLSVQDFGVGFELKPGTARGVGLYSMEERAGILGGSVTITSQKTKGTKIEVRIPFTEGGDQ